jgi:uncharacterized protein YjiS (DUF1127 family)
VRVHLAREHALELELGDRALETTNVALDGLRGVLVLLRLREIEQLARVRETFAELVERADDRFELRALASELLRALGVVPDRRVLELPQDFGESLAAALVVKGTPSTPWSAGSGRRSCGVSGSFPWIHLCESRVA